ncbi:hypothetical protein BDC45DRAFT_512408 [Circinella umbellata]|nr:hypothetical protein BDC45DRAFT_512408 [Circinella umbellata]
MTNRVTQDTLGITGILKSRIHILLFFFVETIMRHPMLLLQIAIIIIIAFYIATISTALMLELLRFCRKQTVNFFPLYSISVILLLTIIFILIIKLK